MKAQHNLGGPATPGYRVEHDSMGDVRVPAAAKWQAQTQRAVENFPVSGQGIERSLVRALALLKRAAALENAELGVIDERVAAAIGEVALEVAEGDWDAEFPIDVFQTGSGTSSNMNMNEVLATLASERLGGRSTPTTRSTRRSRPTTCSRRLSTWRRQPRSSNSLIPALGHLAKACGRNRRSSPAW